MGRAMCQWVVVDFCAFFVIANSNVFDRAGWTRGQSRPTRKNLPHVTPIPFVTPLYPLWSSRKESVASHASQFPSAHPVPPSKNRCKVCVGRKNFPSFFFFFIFINK
jgi:hypothetical protein